MSAALENVIIPKVLHGERISRAEALEIYRHAAPADGAGTHRGRRRSDPTEKEHAAHSA